MKRAMVLLLLLSMLLTGCRAASTAEMPPPTPTSMPTAEPAPNHLPAAEKLIITALPVTPSPTVPPTPTPSPTPSPTPTPTPSPTPEPTPLGLLPWTMGDLFSFDKTVDREYEYKSDRISITMNRFSDSNRTGKSLVYFVADIYIQNIESFRRAQCAEKFNQGTPKSIKALSEANNAILSMSGDYCHGNKKAFSVINGEVVHDTRSYRYDLCVLYRDGSMEMIPARKIDPKLIMEKDPWITWNFGPILLDDTGSPLERFNLPDSIDGMNPRAVLGYYHPGHYCFVLVDGRQSGYSVGLTIPELAKLMQDLGCTAAYNLDGGISAQIAWHGKRVNHPGKNRSIRDILYITEP